MGGSSGDIQREQRKKKEERRRKVQEERSSFEHTDNSTNYK